MTLFKRLGCEVFAVLGMVSFAGFGLPLALNDSRGLTHPMLDLVAMLIILGFARNVLRERGEALKATVKMSTTGTLVFFFSFVLGLGAENSSALRIGTVARDLFVILWPAFFCAVLGAIIYYNLRD